MGRKIEDILFDINTFTGEILINGINLEKVISIDIHMETGKDPEITIVMDVDNVKTKALIRGEFVWSDEGCGKTTP